MQFNNRLADLSNNNSHYNAVEYRQAGHLLVALKATEGTDFVDPNHRTWALHTHSVHSGVVHYHFARPDLGNDPDIEARFFLRVALPSAGPRDYLALDIERATPQGFTHDPAWSHQFDKYVQANSRFHTVLYASRSLLETSDQWLAGDNRRVWDADWSTSPPVAPKGYEWLFRQYTDGVHGPGPHEFAGIGICDGNVMSPAAFDLARRHQPCGA